MSSITTSNLAPICGQQNGIMNITNRRYLVEISEAGDRLYSIIYTSYITLKWNIFRKGSILKYHEYSLLTVAHGYSTRLWVSLMKIQIENYVAQWTGGQMKSINEWHQHVYRPRKEKYNWESISHFSPQRVKLGFKIFLCV